jgi:hypothetical protein
MVCMSVGHKIRLFEVWPKDVDARFENIRTWGAFLVSATIENGRVSGVSLFSERGRSCTFVNPWKDRTVRLFRNGKSAETLSGDELIFPTSVGEPVSLVPM